MNFQNLIKINKEIKEKVERANPKYNKGRLYYCNIYSKWIRCFENLNNLVNWGVNNNNLHNYICYEELFCLIDKIIFYKNCMYDTIENKVIKSEVYKPELKCRYKS